MMPGFVVLSQTWNPLVYIETAISNIYHPSYTHTVFPSLSNSSLDFSALEDLRADITGDSMHLAALISLAVYSSLQSFPADTPTISRRHPLPPLESLPLAF